MGSTIVCFVALAVLGGLLWRRNPSPTIVYSTSSVLIAIGLIFTFPLTWKLFGI